MRGNLMAKGSLVDTVQDKIIEMVLTQTVDNDDQIDQYIFTEGDLAEKFLVSRSTIREAVRSLEVRGFVERVHGKGIKLIDKSHDVLTRSLTDLLTRNGVDYTELFEIRSIFEIEAAKLAAMRADEEVELMEKTIEVMEDKNVSYKEYLNADSNFHRLIIRATKNKTLEALVSSYDQLIYAYTIAASTNTDYRPEITKGYHKKILKHIKLKDSKGAALAMAEHLKAAMERLEAN